MNFRLYFLLTLFIPITVFSQLPTLEWVSSTDGPDNCDSHDIHLNDDGTILSVGSFFGQVDFDPTPGVFEMQWIFEAGFLQKLDANGNFLWVRGFGFQEQGEVRSVSVETDEEGNIYIAGEYNGPADFDPGEGEEIVEDFDGETSIYLVKLDSEGNFVWVKLFYATGDTQIFDMHVANDRVYLAGTWNGSMDFDPGIAEDIVQSVEFYDGFFISLDLDGNLSNYITYGSESSSRLESVTSSPNGDIAVSGAFSNTVDFDPGEGVFEMTSNGGSDVFVATYSADLELVWAKRFGSPATDNVKDIIVDSQGSIITTGYFRQTADFDPDDPVFEVEAAGVSGQPDGFVHKLDNQGNFQWVYTYGGVSYDEGNGVAVDYFGDVYMNGRYAATADFLPGDEVLEVQSPGSSDGFVLGLDGDDGSLRFLSPLLASAGSRMGDIAIDQSGSLFVSGRFGGTAEFNPDPNTSTTDDAVSVFDHFNWKLGQCILDTVASLEAGILSINPQEGASYQWYACDDEPILIEGATDPIFDPEQDGFYYVEISLDDCVKTSECIEVISLNVNNEDISGQLVLFPNPARESIQIRGLNIQTVEIFDVSGQLIKTTPLSDIDVSTLNAGVYLVRIQTQKGIGTKRLIITR